MKIPRPDEKVLTTFLDWLVDIDVPVIIASVQELKGRYPEKTAKELAKKIFSRAEFKSAVSGGLTGIPSNLLAMLPAALVDVGIVLRIEVIATAKVAILFDQKYFDDDDAALELLIPVFGINAASQFFRELGVKAGQSLTRVVIKKYISKGTLAALKKFLIKYLGIKITQKALITKTVPIIGGIIGAGWNWAEVRLLRKRAIRYFESA